MAIHFPGAGVLDALTEIIGYKCGVAVSRPELKRILRRIGRDDIASVDEESYIRIHSSDFEEVVFDLLRSFGRLEEGFQKHFSIQLWHRVKRDSSKAKIYHDVMEKFTEFLRTEVPAASARGDKLMDPTKFMEDVFDQHGAAGLDICMFLIRGMDAAQKADPWGGIRQVEWKNTIDLKELFESEKLIAEYGAFIDQRYIDFLHRNFPEIDRIHWRKFEQLTAEYLDREGYKVALGPGRGDDGVDVRAWIDNSESAAPHIVVQCKRQRDAVPKIVLKALYADVIHERADSGLLVTTSRISPGAEDTRLARAYPIEVADRATLRTWLEAMRKPGVGGFYLSD
jgi:restriction system protein